MGVGTPVSEELAWSYDEVRALQQSVRDMQDDVQVKAQELSERDSALSSLREEVVELSAQVDQQQQQQQQTLWAREASEVSLQEAQARLQDDVADRDYTISMLKEELDDKTADAAALRAAIGEAAVGDVVQVREREHILCRENTVYNSRANSVEWDSVSSGGELGSEERSGGWKGGRVGGWEGGDGARAREVRGLSPARFSKMKKVVCE
jgi:TolA-binding protein